MNIDTLNGISAEVFKTILFVSGPPLIVGLVIGLLVGFFQTITQIQEFTLTFVPKMVGVFACLFLMMPWMADKIVTFTSNIITNIPTYIR